MVWDILIDVALAATTFAMAWVGVHVSLYPVTSEKDKRARKKWFIALGAFAIALTIAQGIRNEITQNDLLGAIRSNKPVVNVQPAPVTVNNIPAARSKDVQLALLYENHSLYRAALKNKSNTPKTISLSSFQVGLSGTASAQLSARLFLSIPATNQSQWQDTASEERGFPLALWEGSPNPVSPGETWNTTDLTVILKSEPSYPIKGRLKVFFGGENPAEADFTIVKP